MENVLFIIQMYVSRVLLATLLMYAYLINANPTSEGRLEKNSPAFFSKELETADEADDQENYQDIVESSQE